MTTFTIAKPNKSYKRIGLGNMNDFVCEKCKCFANSRIKNDDIIWVCPICKSIDNGY